MSIRQKKRKKNIFGYVKLVIRVLEQEENYKHIIKKTQNIDNKLKNLIINYVVDFVELKEKPQKKV